MSEPDVAVVFGTYNRIKHLQRAVASLREKAGLPFRMVVVDGGSTDGTREWLATQDDVVLIGQRGPLTGAVRAFNLGFGYAIEHSQYICQLNDDCELVTPGGLARAIEILESDLKIGAVAFAFDLWRPYGFDYINGFPYVNFGMIRREAGQAVARAQGDASGRNWWNPIYRTYGADSEFGCQLWTLGWKIHAAPDIQVHDLNVQDELRVMNEANVPDRKDTLLFWQRWTGWTAPG